MIGRRELLGSLAATALAAGCRCRGPRTGPPNVVLVLTDDLRHDHRFGFVVMSMEHGIQIVLKLSWSARWYRLKKAARVFRSAFVSQ